MNPLKKFLTNSTVARRVAGKLGYGPSPGFPAGDFYSPQADLREIKARESAIFGGDGRQLPGIDLRETEQVALLKSFVRFYAEMPFAVGPQEGLRYRFHHDGEAYHIAEACFLHAMIRHAQPKRIIEVGGGFSTQVILDTNERFFGGKIGVDLIAPQAGRLTEALGAGDRVKVAVHEKPLQGVTLAMFRELEAGDILFIDSSHVSRVGSDVNHYLFEILPVLKPGVFVQISDIFTGFEYPKEWIYEGKAWTESYLLRAFLQYNPAFEIALLKTFMQETQETFLREQMPSFALGTGGSIWLRKTA